MSAVHLPRLLGPDQAQSVLISRSAVHHASRYDPFGCRGGAHSGVAFNGQLPESCTGHYLLGHGHRAYSPGLRRFLSPDGLSPFGKGGANAYVYCQGDPVNSTDPTGSISRPLLVLGAVAGLGVSIALWQGGIELSKKYGQKVIQNADGSYRTDNTMDVVAGALIMLGFVMLIGTTVGVRVGLKRAKISSNVAAEASVRPPTPPGTDLGSSVCIDPAGAESFVYNQAFHTERLLNWLSYFRSSRQSLHPDLRNFIPNAQNRGLNMGPVGRIMQFVVSQSSNIRRS